MLDLEYSSDTSGLPVEPDHVDQAHRFGGRNPICHECCQAAVAQLPASVGTAAVVGCDPAIEAQRTAEIAQPALHLVVRGVGHLLQGAQPFRRRRFFAHAEQVSSPGSLSCCIFRTGWCRVAAAAHIEHQAGDGTKVVGQQAPVIHIHTQGSFAQREVVVPAPELEVRSGQRVVALHDGGVEGHHQPGRWSRRKRQ